MDTPNKICNESVKYFDKYLFILIYYDRAYSWSLY